MNSKDELSKSNSITREKTYRKDKENPYQTRHISSKDNVHDFYIPKYEKEEKLINKKCNNCVNSCCLYLNYYQYNIKCWVMIIQNW